jgi:hypothetical protein
MRWLSCSYRDLLALPDGYIEVVIGVAKREAAEARMRSRGRR